MVISLPRRRCAPQSIPRCPSDCESETWSFIRRGKRDPFKPVGEELSRRTRFSLRQRPWPSDDAELRGAQQGARAIAYAQLAEMLRCSRLGSDAPISLLGIGLGLWRRSYAKSFAHALR